MMNAELVAAGEQRIIIPTIFRANYLSALKAISGRSNATALVRTLDFAQRFTQSVDWTSYDKAESDLKSVDAFMDSLEADDKGIRLRLLSERT
jgi:hypothetical protein